MVSTTTPEIKLFGIRHHGPGSARSLLLALEQFQADCILIEGPPEAQEILDFVDHVEMQTPVALMTYCPDNTQYASYHPFAEFSPEWQALLWAKKNQTIIRWIDLPMAHRWAQKIALEKTALEATKPTHEDDNKTVLEQPLTQATASDEISLGTDDSEQPANQSVDELANQSLISLDLLDPLDRFAQTAGFSDGEAWWNYQIEERLDASEMFATVAEVMTALREDSETASARKSVQDQQEEELREAYMRQCLRQAKKEGFQKIAVVCGAWHVPALDLENTQLPNAKADSACLKGLPKVKVNCTWVPWTMRHLSNKSGYGAGIESPQWYQHIWQGLDAPARAAVWLSKIANLLRQKDLDCSSANVIEAVRLANTLAALRQLPSPALAELQESALAILANGQDSILNLIEDELLVGSLMGHVPSSVPTVPLQKDFEQLLKTLRLKTSAEQKTLDLDLRKDSDLQRSQLLHRLKILGINWGYLNKVGQSSKGSFHEIWTLEWQPEFALLLIEASVWGISIETAANAKISQQAEQTSDLGELSKLINLAILAQLSHAVPALIQRLANCAAVSNQADQLLATLAPLANVYRYGNVRNTNSELIAQVLDGLITRCAIALPLACQSLNDESAIELRPKILEAQTAIELRQSPEHLKMWFHSQHQIAQSHTANSLLKGLATRLLLDQAIYDSETTQSLLMFHLSLNAMPAKASQWLDGFLNQNAAVLLHDNQVWHLVNAWLAQLSTEHFENILPLVRKSFSYFESPDRQDLAQKAAQLVPIALSQSHSSQGNHLNQANPTLHSTTDQVYELGFEPHLAHHVLVQNLSDVFAMDLNKSL